MNNNSKNCSRFVVKFRTLKSAMSVTKYSFERRTFFLRLRLLYNKCTFAATLTKSIINQTIIKLVQCPCKIHLCPLINLENRTTKKSAFKSHNNFFV